MEKITKYFPFLNDEQRAQLTSIGQLYREWNEKINVISRKDIDNLYERHILHSLAIGKFITPAKGTRILDLGTGGGFPGIPLAILWPQCRFHLIDRIGKKIKVASSIAESVGLTNVTFQHGDIGECHDKFAYVVSRAVMQLPDIIKSVRKNISTQSHNSFPPGLLCLKGKDMATELAAVRRPVIEVPLSDFFTEEFFTTKSLIYVDMA